MAQYSEELQAKHLQAQIDNDLFTGAFMQQLVDSAEQKAAAAFGQLNPLLTQVFAAEDLANQAEKEASQNYYHRMQLVVREVVTNDPAKAAEAYHAATKTHGRSSPAMFTLAGNGANNKPVMDEADLLAELQEGSANTLSQS